LARDREINTGGAGKEGLSPSFDTVFRFPPAAVKGR
jgi:hypothetical protein